MTPKYEYTGEPAKTPTNPNVTEIHKLRKDGIEMAAVWDSFYGWMLWATWQEAERAGWIGDRIHA